MIQDRLEASAGAWSVKSRNEHVGAILIFGWAKVVAAARNKMASFWTLSETVSISRLKEIRDYNINMVMVAVIVTSDKSSICCQLVSPKPQ